MSLNALHPMAGKHSIQSAAFVLLWATPLETAQLEAIRKFAEQLKPYFSVVQEQQTTIWDIPAGDIQGEPKYSGQSELAGVHFVEPNSTLGPAGVTRALRVNKENLNVVINDYEKWSTSWDQVVEWLSLILPVVLGGRPINGVILQYNDAFEWRAASSELKLSEVFNPAGTYLSRKAFEYPNLWHVHQGYLDERSAPIPHQLIENVNVTVTEPKDRRTITIFTSHQGMLKEPIWQLDQVLSKVTELLADFHERNKSILKDVLSKEVCQKINLQ